MLPAQVMVVERLQDHVAELGVADADVAIFHPRTHALLGHHCVDLEMLADIAQHVEERERCGPVGVIHHQGRVGFLSKIQKAGQLFFDSLNVSLELLVGE